MAVRITLKRSSIYNKRPNAEILDPGELALNTNALSPGLFFEADNNEVVKVGPTQVGPEAPVLTPSLGESWYNEVTGELNIGSLSKLSTEEVRKVWQRVSSPYLGGTDGYVVFVAPEFPNATDNLYNNGQANPFQTINRAVIEIAKQSITRQNEIDDGQNNRYTIVVAPGRSPVYNDPGVPLPTANTDPDSKVFDVNFDNDLAAGGDVNILDLIQFNPETGGLLIPRGTSIIGMDLRKTNVLPSYVPDYQNPVNGIGFNEPITSIFKWTGNSYVNDLTFRDKNPEAFVNSFDVSTDGLGVLLSTRPHGFSYNDKVFVDFSPAANRSPLNPRSQGVSAGFYYVKPISLYGFQISTTSLSGPSSNFIERGQLPKGEQGLGYILSVNYELTSHHRLRVLYNASFGELTEFYQKIQLAFRSFFENRIDQANVSNPGETEIVAPTFVSPAGNRNLESNLNTQASPYAQNCSLKSMYGLCGIEQDGSRVSGFKSAQATSFTVASLQRDPMAYEVYATVVQPETGQSITGWYPLAQAAWNTLAPVNRPQFYVQVPREVQLKVLNETPITNIRYYYESQQSPEGLSYGITNYNVDFRHFGFRASNGGYAQIDTGWCICTAVGFWATGGGKLTVTNSSNNFGSVAVRTEGFAGIGTIGGALPEDQGFVFSGIRMPLELEPSETTQQEVYSLNANVLEVRLAPTGDEDPEIVSPFMVQEVILGSGFEPISLLPFSLAPNTAVWVSTPTGLFRGFFVDDGFTTTILNEDGTTTLRLRAIDSTIPNTTLTSGWNLPFIRRFNDQRTIGEQSYSLILSNTTAGHRPPVQGSILRLNQTTPSNNSKLVRPLVQFDPGPAGGWGRIFQVVFGESTFVGDSGQVNEVMINRFTDQSYYVGLSLADGARPWLQDYRSPHGQYVTYEERNWYAAANDLWDRVYYSDKIEPLDDVLVNPTEFNSVFAVSACTENQYLTKKTYQGEYGVDPLLPVYNADFDYYYRGSQVEVVNYNFDLYFNQDNGTPNFGLLRHVRSTNIQTKTTAVLKKDEFTLSVESVANIPSPKTTFVVVRLGTATNFEYLQVVGINANANTLIVQRGLYNSEKTADWPAGTTVTLQTAANRVSPLDYDLDWMNSKASMIRFLEVMGFSRNDIAGLLFPRTSSKRNVSASEFNLPVGKGYAVSTGPWSFEFNQPSSIVAGYHSYHSAGYYDYARGLPQYKNSAIPTKQYYDFLSTSLWGSDLQVIASDESGDIIFGAAIKEQGTGRPYGTLSSNITSYTQTAAGGGEDEAGTVRQIDTGEGLVGGPITTFGTISLLPATEEIIGGVKPGSGLKISADGTLSATGDGSVTSITAGIGLEGGTITTSGTIDLKSPTPPSSGQGLGEIGGVYPFFGMNYDPDNGELNVNITDDLKGTAKNFAISQYAANILASQIQALVGVNVLAGTFDASTGRLVTVSPAGASKGFVVGQNVPPASLAIDNYFVIVTRSGSGAQTPLPPGPAQAGDWYICQADAGTSPAWLLIDFDNAEVVASSVIVTPPIPGIETAGNVQTALQAIELQVQDRIEFVQVQDEDNTNALFADVTRASPTAYDGTTLKIGVNTASTSIFGVTKLTSDFTGTAQNLALNQAGASALNAKVDALAGANVLAGTYNASTGTVLTTTPAGSRYLTVGQNCPPAGQVPDNYYVLVTVAGTKGPPGAIVPSTGVQSGDWFVVEQEKGFPASWVTIDFENTSVIASQVRLQPLIVGISSGNVQGALEELLTKTNNSFTDIVPATLNTSGISVTNTPSSTNGRQSTLKLLPATSQDIGGVFVIPDTGLQLTPAGGVGLLPATTSKLGGVIVGDGLSITQTGVLSATGGGGTSLSQIDDISIGFNGSQSQFSLKSGGIPISPSSNIRVLIVIGGIVQTAGSAYTVSGSNITFTSPPPTGASFYGLYFG